MILSSGVVVNVPGFELPVLGVELYVFTKNLSEMSRCVFVSPAIDWQLVQGQGSASVNRWKKILHHLLIHGTVLTVERLMSEEQKLDLVYLSQHLRQ